MSEISPLRVDVNGLFDHMIGPRGFERGAIDALAPRVKVVLEALAARRTAGELPFYELPSAADTIARCRELAASVQGDFDRMLVLGIGGSALGTKAVLDALSSAAPLPGLEVTVLDNVDPATFSQVLGAAPIERTLFNVISKSGDTAETAAQLLIVRSRLIEAVGEQRWRDHVIVTTDPESGLLRELARNDELRTLDVPAGVGGRFTVLSAVGLFPLAVAGIDIGALCAGARAMDERTSGSDVWNNPAALHAALLYLAYDGQGRNVHVLMPYADGLLRLAEWYGQLWAESLGKRSSLDGAVVETGQVPVRALGATDQHSQVQLYVEGPHDKVVTFIRVDRHAGDVAIPSAGGPLDDFSYLSGHTLGELLNMEQKATECALVEAGRPTSLIAIERIDEAALGQLFHLFQVQTLVMAGLLGVDPLDQPGVEAGKIMTQAMAGRAGTEAVAERVGALAARRKDDLVV